MKPKVHDHSSNQKGKNCNPIVHTFTKQKATSTMSTHLKSIIIFCSDVNKLVNFYQAQFKLKIMGKASEEWTVLNAGPVEIAFHRIGAAYRNSPEDPSGEPNTKLVFEIDEDITLFRERLQANGARMGATKTFPGFPYIFCDGIDPEGNVFQITKPI
ncbi:MAG: VOC family protein [Terrimonas sp.]|nr:VOC family protein [Terrimonas sp.]